MANLFIIAAPSGCGKTSLVKALLEKVNNLTVSTSHTTRDPRPGEIDGKNYFFISKSEFNEIYAKNGFLESAQVFDNFYGTAKQSVVNLLDKGIDVILEIDWQGARQIKKIFTDSIGIFILPPSENELRNRLNDRGQDSNEIINRRMQDAVNEMQHYDEFDYLVINDEFNIALNDLETIILSQRLSIKEQTNKHASLLKSLI